MGLKKYRSLLNEAPARFRFRLQIAVMAAVAGTTGLALFVAQHNIQNAFEGSLREEFQRRVAFLHSEWTVRQTLVAERCGLLARSVRINAALEEDDVEDLYLNAKIELRDILPQEPGAPASDGFTLPQASFFRFVNPSGALLKPEGQPAETWEKAFPKIALKPGLQQIGYITENAPGKAEGLLEVVITPIGGIEGKLLGGLVLGFSPSNFVAAREGPEIKSGIWTNGFLLMAALPLEDRGKLSEAIAASLRASSKASDDFAVTLGRQRYLLFYNLLNPGSQFAPAYQVSLYSLEEAFSQGRSLQLKILAIGFLALLGALGAGHYISGQLSKPVEKLAQDSVLNQALRDKAQAALELTEQKYRSIFENAVEGIFLLDAQGRYVSANPALARIYGFNSSQELIAALPDPARQLYLNASDAAEFLRRASAEGGVVEFEAEMIRKDGQKIWVAQNAHAIRGADGTILHYEGTLEDITERKRLADAIALSNQELQQALTELKETQRQLIQQERLRALGQMASGIAHDFNNALTPIIGFVELLLSVPGVLADEEKALEYLKVIRTAATDAASVVARLREFYRNTETTEVFKPVNLARMVEQVVVLTQPKWKDQALVRGAEVKVEQELREVPPIAGEESLLREILTNLIFNAVDAMPVGGKLILRTRSDSGRAILEVQDTGTGMSEEVRERCMEPFFSTKGEMGTGLGLSMVFGIVKRHGGEIQIDSAPGKGTRFILSFPQFTATEATGGQEAVGSRHGPLKILVVDDEKLVRQAVSALLESDGHLVETAPDGLEGLKRLKEQSPDLVITDRAMPGMSGEQLAAAVKDFSPRIRVVLLSGFNSNSEKDKMDCVDALASKPIVRSALREAIAKAMNAA